jgi:hypothetical protein
MNKAKSKRERLYKILCGFTVYQKPAEFDQNQSSSYGHNDTHKIGKAPITTLRFGYLSKALLWLRGTLRRTGDDIKMNFSGGGGWTGFIWLSIRSTGELFEHGNEPSGPTKGEKFDLFRDYLHL